MIDEKHKALGIAARVVVLMALAGQILIVIANWWMFGSRRSCSHLIDWAEWIACVQGDFYFAAAACAILWIVAGIGALLGRFLPPYISAIVPLGMAVAVIWFALKDLNLSESLTPLYAFLFVITDGLIAMPFAGPVVGAWLWGLSRRRSPLRLSSAFDSAT